VVCDFPEANKLTIHILAAVAEYEAQMISAGPKARYRLPGGGASSWVESAAGSRWRSTRLPATR
jgi:hypothetical protein